MRISGHWKIWLVLFPIIGTCAYGQPAPGGLGANFAFQWWNKQINTAPTNGLRLWLPFTTNFNDAGPQKFAVTNNNGVTLVNGTAFFNGTNSWLRTGAIGAGAAFGYPVQTVTYSVWVKPSQSAVQKHILTSANAINNDYQGTILHTTLYQFSIYEGATKNITNGTVSVGNWSHIAVTISGSSDKRRAYFNGVFVAEDSFSGDNFPYDYLNIGTALTSAYFSGYLDNVRMYNRVLTDAEILLLYQEGHN